MKNKKEEVVAFIASDNIFADFEYKNPEEAKAKSDLAIQIYQTIKNRGLTQKEAADILDIAKTKISDIVRGKLSKFLRYLVLLGNDLYKQAMMEVRSSIAPKSH